MPWRCLHPETQHVLLNLHPWCDRTANNNKHSTSHLPQRSAQVTNVAPVSREPYRRSRQFFLPSQRQKREFREPLDWNTFVQRHHALLNARRVRNKLLRRVVGFAKQLRHSDALGLQRVVYAAVHPRSSKVYIGSTKHDVLWRFKCHVYQRHAPRSTALSKHIASRPGTIDEVLQQFYILPLEILPPEFPEGRFEEREFDWMRKFSPKRLLNKYVLRTNRRRHAPVPQGPPQENADHYPSQCEACCPS